MNNGPSWQSTLIALALIGLVGAIFLVVFNRAGIDSALKAWGAVGTIVGVLTGAIPTYFFGKAAVDAERKERNRAEADVRTLMALLPPNLVEDTRRTHPELFYRP